MSATPNFDRWARVAPANSRWAGFQHVLSMDGNATWWLNNYYAIAQDNLGAWQIVVTGPEHQENFAGPFDSPQAAYATLRLLS